MANLTVKGNPLGSGTFTVEPPNSNTSRTITLPDATTTLVGTDATQTLTNKTIQGGALTLGTAQASTSGTTKDFTGIPSWVKRVTVMFDGFSTSGTSMVLVQLGDSGGIENTGYLGSATTVGLATVAGAVWDAAGINMNNSMVSTYVVSGNLQIVNLTGNTWIASGVFGLSNTSGTFQTAGTKTLSATLDRIRISTVNGTDTFDAGSINIMYEG